MSDDRVQRYIDRINAQRGHGDADADGDDGGENLSQIGRLIRQENERRGRAGDGD